MTTEMLIRNSAWSAETKWQTCFADTMYTVRHKSGPDNQTPWKYIKTVDSNVRIPLNTYNNGEEVHIQVGSVQELENYKKMQKLVLTDQLLGTFR